MRSLIFELVREAARFHIALRSVICSAFLAFLGILLYAASSYAVQVTLEWNPNTEQDLAGYKVYQGTSSRNYDVSMDVGNWTSTTIGTLEDNETYYFTVAAYDTDGNESGYSNEICINCQTNSSGGGGGG